MSGAPDLTKPAASGWESVHLVQQAPDPESLRAAGLHVAEIDGGPIDSKQDLMAAIAHALEFPDYFGANWDALDECLRDLGWISAPGYVLIVGEAGDLWKRAPELSGRLVSSWTFSSATWTDAGTPFHLVLVR